MPSSSVRKTRCYSAILYSHWLIFQPSTLYASTLKEESVSRAYKWTDFNVGLLKLLTLSAIAFILFQMRLSPLIAYNSRGTSSWSVAVLLMMSLSVYNVPVGCDLLCSKLHILLSLHIVFTFNDSVNEWVTALPDLFQFLLWLFFSDGFRCLLML